MVASVEPAVIGVAEAVEGANVDHDSKVATQAAASRPRGADQRTPPFDKWRLPRGAKRPNLSDDLRLKDK
jgi:hypothetical protein